MLPDRMSNPGPLTYESGALPIALRGPATSKEADDKILKIGHLKLYHMENSKTEGQKE